jgi:hypothetical protein
VCVYGTLNNVILKIYREIQKAKNKQDNFEEDRRVFPVGYQDLYEAPLI